MTHDHSRTLATQSDGSLGVQDVRHLPFDLVYLALAFVPPLVHFSFALDDPGVPKRSLLS